MLTHALVHAAEVHVMQRARCCWTLHAKVPNISTCHVDTFATFFWSLRIIANALIGYNFLLQMEFNRGLLDTVVKASCIVELQRERDLEAQKADMFLKAVANIKHAAVSDLVDARTSVMLASQIALEVWNILWYFYSRSTHST
jgi:hypothetical protein